MPQWHDYFLLLDAVKMQYDFVLVDLPELVNPATREIVQRARQVFTVCTPELPSLRLAQRRLEELRGWRVPDDRIQLLLNRWHSGDISPDDVRALIGRPVFQVIPNDYPTVRRAMMEGRTVGPATKLGKAFGDLAAALLQSGSPAEKSGALSRLRGFLRPKTTA
jgi:Flp pilus assembly CpaE family ATPase